MKKFIISRTDNIGDVVLTLPLAGIIKEHFPESEVVFLCKNYTVPIVSCSDYVDRVIDFDELLLMDEQQQINQIREVEAEAVIFVFPDKRAMKLAKKSGIKLRIATSRRLQSMLYCNSRVKFSRKKSDLHEAQLNTKLLIPVGINKEFSLEDLARYYGMKKPQNKSGHERLIDPRKFNLILHPKSKGSAREWGLENYLKLIDLLDSEKYNIFISGTESEGKEMQSLFSSAGDRVVDITGKMSLSEFISFIAKADGLFAASTGPLHIAAALGKNTLGVYAPMRPIHPGRWAPIGKKSSYLVLDKICSDCRKTEDCHCIRAITPEQVVEIIYSWKKDE